MTLQNKEAAWFLAQLKPNCIQIAGRNLKRQGIDTFIPMRDETEQRKGKFVTTTRPLFPGYIFVALDVSEGLWRKVNSTYGITRLVSFGAAPATVPLDLVTELIQRCDDEGKLLPPEHFKPGDQVMLTKGPFTATVAEIERVAPDQRVWVLMEIMGGKTRVGVEADSLQRVN